MDVHVIMANLELEAFKAYRNPAKMVAWLRILGSKRRAFDAPRTGRSDRGASATVQSRLDNIPGGARLETITLDQIDQHCLEAFLALTYDLAILESVDEGTLAQIACNIGIVVRRLGAGTSALKRFVTTCDHAFRIHNVFTQFTSDASTAGA